jgi:prevent-host-death family protein
MTKTVSISEAQTQLQGLLALARNGDEIIIEENGKPIAKITPIKETEQVEPKTRIFGLGKGKSWMSEDFDDELPDEFWGFDKEL